MKAFKYLGVWFDRGRRKNVQLEKMKEKAEEWAGKTEWMSRTRRMGRSKCREAEIWWPGGKAANEKLEAAKTMGQSMTLNLKVVVLASKIVVLVSKYTLSVNPIPPGIAKSAFQ